MEYRCLLWDFDGTLADTGSDVWNSLTYAARRAGGAIDDLYMRDDANLADPMDEIMRHVIPYPGEAYLETFEAFRCLVWVRGSGGGAGRVVWGYGYHVVVHRRPATA